VSLRTAAALLAAGCAGAAAQPASLEVTGSVGLVHRKLVERAPSGATLLTERGPMAQLQLQAVRPLEGGGAVGLRGHLAGGDLDYDGQTQAGVPLTTITRQWEGGADLLFRPVAPAAWGEAWLTLGWLANRRAIRSTPIAGGLDEVSSAALVGALWRSPGFTPVPQWTARVEAEARVSVVHRLRVDFYGLLDRTSFDGGRKRLLTLRVLASPQESPWTWGLEWSGLWQPESRAVGVSRNGLALPGITVRQPELSTQDVTLRVTRSF
jgi:hypothetical protein